MTKQAVSVREHLEMQLRYEAEVRKVHDRRYSEVQTERQRALAYKESADALALELARTHQSYLDVKANQLREQINSERGLYATKDEIAPLAAFVSAQQGGSKVWMVVLTITLATAAIVAANVIPLLK